LALREDIVDLFTIRRVANRHFQGFSSEGVDRVTGHVPVGTSATGAFNGAPTVSDSGDTVLGRDGICLTADGASGCGLHPDAGAIPRRSPDR